MRVCSCLFRITVRMVLGEIDAEDEGGREGEPVGGDGTTAGEDKKETRYTCYCSCCIISSHC